MEFGSGVRSAKAPIDAGLCLVPLLFQGLDLSAKGFPVRIALPETAAGEYTELDLDHI